MLLYYFPITDVSIRTTRHNAGKYGIPLFLVSWFPNLLFRNNCVNFQEEELVVYFSMYIYYHLSTNSCNMLLLNVNENNISTQQTQVNEKKRGEHTDAWCSFASFSSIPSLSTMQTLPSTSCSSLYSIKMCAAS